MHASIVGNETAFPSPRDLHAPGIVLTWLARLRWVAVVGQIGAVGVTVWPLGLHPPLAPIGAVIAITLLSNLALHGWIARGRVRPEMIAGVLMVDMGLLSGLLYFTGGVANPFSILYLVHVALAVAVLEPPWAWAMVAVAMVCYATLWRWHRPMLTDGTISPRLLEAGQAAAVFIAAGVTAYFIGRITGSLRLRETELADIRERARRNAQMAALTTLAAGAAHELGTPLGTIAVVAKELEIDAAKIGAGESIVADAKLIRAEVDRCRGILDRMRGDLLNDRPDAPGVEVVELIARLKRDLQADQRDRLDVNLEGVQGVIGVPAAATEQSLCVLLKNAFDAIGANGRVALMIERRDGQVIFRVRDGGAGMSPEVLERAGEPFFTTKPPGEGMGLGLYLARLVAEKHGGRLWLVSTPGDGTTATLVLRDETGRTE